MYYFVFHRILSFRFQVLYLHHFRYLAFFLSHIFNPSPLSSLKVSIKYIPWCVSRLSFSSPPSLDPIYLNIFPVLALTSSLIELRDCSPKVTGSVSLSYAIIFLCLPAPSLFLSRIFPLYSYIHTIYRLFLNVTRSLSFFLP